MRTLQIGIFVLGVISFLAALFFIGQQMGDTLWRVGVGTMVIDLVFIQLWPFPRSS